jgi:hypothetical protein
LPDATIAFFSYSREDSEFALRLAADLRAGGAGVWIDQLDIGPGQHWDRAVQQALSDCPCLLLILSPASANSENVLDEVSYAIDKQKTIIPILHRECDIPFRVRRFQHLDFRHDYDRMLQELRKCLLPEPKPQEDAAAVAAPAASVVKHEPAAAASPLPPQTAPAPAQRMEPVAHTRSQGSHWSIPIWVTAPVLLVLMVLGIYWAGHRNSSPAEPGNAADHIQGVDRSSGNAAKAPKPAAGNPEIMGAALSHAQTSPPCSLPAASDSAFAVTDPAVWFFFAFRHGSPDDQWTVDWVEPNGYVHKTNTVGRNAAAGRYCFEMKIAGTPAQNAPGQWTVRLNRNSVEVAERSFRLTR